MLSLLQRLFLKQFMKAKILNIIEDIKKLINQTPNISKFWIDWYGAYDIDPKYLVIWICIETDKEKSVLNSQSDLKIRMRNVLFQHGYPETAIPFVHIEFESQETVDRESGGSWYDHFK